MKYNDCVDERGLIKKVVYQIYPLSFKSTTSKPHGDIRGVISKLDYIKSLGVDYIWLQPVFKSNFRDNGYDVIDYYKVDPKFGTDEDLVELVSEARKRNLFVMLDMVFNHTSTDSDWFQGWLKGESKYRDFYISREAHGKPPTNWKSKFGGSAWKEYKPNHWYLHLFDVTQADLNWENPAVREELKKVIRFYLKMGVAGFRFDVINLVSKGSFENDLVGDGRRFYTDGPRAHEFVAELSREFPKSDKQFFTVAELSSTNFSNAAQYANKNRTEFDASFIFHHLKVDYVGNDKFIYKKPDLASLNDILASWSTDMQNVGATLANFLNNHDQPRAVSRLIDRQHREAGAKMLFGLIHSMPGATFIYQGEEIGMTNPDFDNKKDYRDVETLNYFDAHNLKTASAGIKQKSRDNSRTPMQWDGSIYAGFSQVQPWINIPANAKQINVAAQEKDAASVLNFYRDYIKWTKINTFFEKADIVWNPFSDNIMSFTRSHAKRKLLFVFSFNNTNKVYAYDSSKVLFTNYPLSQLVKNTLKPYQFMVVELHNA